MDPVCLTNLILHGLILPTVLVLYSTAEHNILKGCVSLREVYIVDLRVRIHQKKQLASLLRSDAHSNFCNKNSK
jgi:hypothetical protein